MPLIFAIDSDKRQSAQLASLLRSHVEADLVQCAAAVEGLDILQGRVPDLILTSSLLSPRDETALDNYLRELGVAAAHVQTLTIPVIAGASAASGKKKKPAGMLAALRREKKPAAKPSGCDPDMFAREVQLYLERAMEQRETLRAVLPENIPTPVVDAETAESLIAAVTSVEPAAEPPTIVMLAPTVVAVVVKQPQAAQPEAVQLEPEPQPEPEPLPAILDASPSIILPPEPQPESAPVSLLLMPIVEAVIEIDPMEQLLAVPAAMVEAAEQLLVAPAPEPELAPAPQPEPEPEPVAEGLPALELSPAIIEPTEIEAAAEPFVPGPVAEPASERSWSFEGHREESLPLDQLLQRAVTDVGETAALTEPAPAEPEVAEAAAPTAAAPIEPAPTELPPTELPPIELPPIERAPIERAPIEASAEPDLVEPIALGSEPESLENAQFAALLAPPPTRIADAIRMPEEPVPTIDMVECHDLDALADDFVAYGLTADLPDRPAVVNERLVEPVIEPAIEPVIELSVEPVIEVAAVEAAAVAERAEEAEALAEPLPVLDEPVEAAAVAERAEEAEALAEPLPVLDEPVEAAAVAERAEEAEALAEPLPVLDEPVEAAAVAVPVVEAPVVEAPAVEAPVAELPTLAWSWLEEKALPLADLFSRKFGSTPAPLEVFTPVIEAPDVVEAPMIVEAPAVVEAVEEAPPVEEIYDPVASASWNMAATVPAVEDRTASGDAAPAPVPVEAAAIEPPPAEEPVVTTESGTWDPVSAAAWQSAVSPAPTVPPAPEPVQAAAPQPEPEPQAEPAVAAMPEPDGPLLDPEVLAILGLAAHRAGLDAMETLDAPPPPARSATSDGPSRKKSRQDRSSQTRQQRRDPKPSRAPKQKEERPAQDEWGMFDPAQCGPAALFDDEEWAIDEDDDDGRPSRPRASTY